MKFNVGQVVSLVSGGPAMTAWKVNDEKDTPVYDCEWFTGDGLLHRDAFGEMELVGVSTLADMMMERTRTRMRPLGEWPLSQYASGIPKW